MTLGEWIPQYLSVDPSFCGSLRESANGSWDYDVASYRDLEDRGLAQVQNVR